MTWLSDVDFTARSTWVYRYQTLSQNPLKGSRLCETRADQARKSRYWDAVRQGSARFRHASGTFGKAQLAWFNLTSLKPLSPNMLGYEIFETDAKPSVFLVLRHGVTVRTCGSRNEAEAIIQRLEADDIEAKAIAEDENDDAMPRL